MDPEAREFICKLYRSHRRLRLWRYIPAAIYGVIGCAALGVFVGSRLGFIHGPVLMFTIALPCLLGLPISIMAILKQRTFGSRRLDELLADMQAAELVTVSGGYAPSLVQTGDSFAPGRAVGVYRVELDGVTIYVPTKVASRFTSKGEATFTYFPNSHYVWSVNGEVIWRRGNSWFW